MGMFGGAKRGMGTPPFMPDQPGGGYPMPQPRTRTQNVVGIIGDALAGINGQPGRFAATLGKERDEQVMLARQLELARYKAQNPDPTAIQQNAVAGGLKPGSPEYRKWVLENGGRPPQYFMMGGAGGPQQIVGVGGPPAAGSAPAAPSVQPGTVQDGYRYIGGDPASETSWQKVQ